MIFPKLAIVYTLVLLPLEQTQTPKTHSQEIHEREREEKRREEQPKQSTNIANNDFIIIIIIITLWPNFPTWPKIYFQKMKKNNTKIL
jgi:hypothetical protein